MTFSSFRHSRLVGGSSLLWRCWRCWYILVIALYSPNQCTTKTTFVSASSSPWKKKRRIMLWRCFQRRHHVSRYHHKDFYVSVPEYVGVLVCYDDLVLSKSYSVFWWVCRHGPWSDYMPTCLPHYIYICFPDRTRPSSFFFFRKSPVLLRL